MKASAHSTEKGQILILLVFGAVGLLAFAALAVDGGMIFYDRRDAQNAADAAAMAGAYALAKNPGSGLTLDQIRTSIVEPAALSRAADNHFQNDANTTVTVNYPPDESNIYHDNPQYIQVYITSKVDTSLIQFAYEGEVKNTVEAVAHVLPSELGPMYPGNALVSLAPHECSSFSANGDFTALLIDGGIFVNSDCSEYAVVGLSNAKTIKSPSLTVVGGIAPTFLSKGTIVIPDINTGADAYSYPPGIKQAPVPDCGSTAAPYDSSTHTYSPGIISGGFKAKDVKLNPGIYCLTGGMMLNGGDSLEGEGVMLFFTGSNPCDLHWNGNSNIKLSAPTEGVYKGLVMYFDPKDFASWPLSGDLKYNGNSDSYVIGTVYAPACHIKKIGTSDMEFVGQIIGYDFANIGTADLHLTYDPNKVYETDYPAYLDLTQ
ncbi:MAG: pilus assembly protein TadG-related protein [Chloroflexi bacterium]|nr:pilus assembly protein TadG-related protein [Chloroflexota bacterium]